LKYKKLSQIYNNRKQTTKLWMIHNKKEFHERLFQKVFEDFFPSYENISIFLTYDTCIPKKSYFLNAYSIHFINEDVIHIHSLKNYFEFYPVFEIVKPPLKLLELGLIECEEPIYSFDYVKNFMTLMSYIDKMKETKLQTISSYDEFKSILLQNHTLASDFIDTWLYFLTHFYASYQIVTNYFIIHNGTLLPDLTANECFPSYIPSSYINMYAHCFLYAVEHKLINQSQLFTMISNINLKLEEVFCILVSLLIFDDGVLDEEVKQHIKNRIEEIYNLLL